MRGDSVSKIVFQNTQSDKRNPKNIDHRHHHSIVLEAHIAGVNPCGGHVWRAEKLEPLFYRLHRPKHLILFHFILLTSFCFVPESQSPKKKGHTSDTQYWPAVKKGWYCTYISHVINSLVSNWTRATEEGKTEDKMAYITMSRRYKH